MMHANFQDAMTNRNRRNDNYLNNKRFGKIRHLGRNLRIRSGDDTPGA